MLEKDLLAWIIELAERTGWMVLHVPAPMVADRRTGQWRPFKRAAGLPDLFLLHEDPALLVIAEIKGDKGKLSDRQREVLQAFKAVATSAVARHDLADGGFSAEWRPVGVYAWAPADRDIIQSILTSKVLI